MIPTALIPSLFFFINIALSKKKEGLKMFPEVCKNIFSLYASIFSVAESFKKCFHHINQQIHNIPEPNILL